MTGLKIGFWLRAWNIELTLVPSLQVNQKKYLDRKHLWHCLWKGQRSWWDSKENECLWWSSRPKGSLKKMFWEILQNSQENICARIFWCFLVNFAEFVRTPFLQNSTERLILIIAVSIVAKGVLANETVNYNTQTKAYVLISVRSVKLLKGQSRWKNRFQKQYFADLKLGVLNFFLNSKGI